MFKFNLQMGPNFLCFIYIGSECCMLESMWSGERTSKLLQWMVLVRYMQLLQMQLKSIYGEHANNQ
jgi:hypothetical protein